MRFGFWGAEELGLVGSTKYVESLDVDALKDIALYLNFDMLGSPNPGYFTYDGDQSAPPSANGASRGCRRARRVSSARWWPTSRVRARPPRTPTSTAGPTTTRSPRRASPPGGLFAGAEEKKTAEQAQLWGGEADKPFDPNYHKKTDTLDHIDRTALEIQGSGVALRRRPLRAGPDAAATACRSATTAPATW